MSEHTYNPLLLENRKIDVLFRQAPAALVGSFLVVLILYMLLFREFINETLITWFFLYTVLTLCRLIGVLAYQRRSGLSISSRMALNLYAISTVMAGFMWGVLSVYLLEVLDNELIYFMLICIVGLTAASVATYSTSRVCFLLFMVPALAPLTVALFLQDETVFKAIGLLIVMYIFSLLMSWMRINSLMTKALKYEIMHQRLAEEKHQVNLLNQDLKNEIVKRELTEKKLIDEKDKAQALSEELMKLTSLDGLTKINNRRGFDNYLSSEWKRALRDQTSLALILCDIDYFKSFNDTYGHQAGDDCLIRVAIVLESFARRASDFAARYGGEEFGIILPNTGIETAATIAEQVRNAILDLAIPHAGSMANDFVTISFGISAMVPEQQQSPAVLVSRADKALYQSKLEGRNRITCSHFRVDLH